MKACIFVDGENFRWSIVDLFEHEFRKEDYLPRKANWSAFFHHIKQQSGAESFLRSYWYVIEGIDFWPTGYSRLPDDKLFTLLSKGVQYRKQLERETDPIKKSLLGRSIVSHLDATKDRMRSRFDGWKEVQDGISNKYDSIEFRRAGSISYDLFKLGLGKEKAVDVRLAVDLLELRNAYDMAIIVSGDQDYVPAVQVIKNAGKIVTNVTFSTKDGKLLPGGARRLNIITDKRIVISYEECKKLLGI